MELIQDLWLLGANRYRDETVCEQIIGFDEEEWRLAPRWSDLKVALEKAGLSGLLDELPEIDSKLPPGSFGELYPRLCLALQQSVGHRVQWGRSECRASHRAFQVIFEYEHKKTGQLASFLAIDLLISACPGWRPPGGQGPANKDLAMAWAELNKTASQHVFPRDSEALMRAAWRHGIAAIKLDRDPYRGIDGEFRIRPNSLLRLGFCKTSQVLDGMLSLERSGHLADAFHDRMSLYSLSRKYGFATPKGFAFTPGKLPRESLVDALEALGYPLWIKPRRRSHGSGHLGPVRDRSALWGLLGGCLHDAGAMVAQTMQKGDVFRMLSVHGKVLSVFDGNGAQVEDDYPGIARLSGELARQEHCGLLEVSFIEPVGRSGEAHASMPVLDVDFAPRLDRLFGDDGQAISTVAEAFLSWLVPPGTARRVPLVAVTGTNGKTTTCRMVTRMFAESGFHTTMTGTHTRERWIHGRPAEPRLAGGKHFAQLDDPEAEAIVQEVHFGLIARAGFPWQRCTVGIVTNVTEDHLGRIGVENLEQMAELKSVVARRSETMVLNADDERCVAMGAGMPDRPMILVTLKQRPEELLESGFPTQTKVVFCRHFDGERWISLYERGRVMPLISEIEMPATFGGTADFNLANAMHAAAAGLACGLSSRSIVTALRNFRPDFSSSPGRMNLHDNGQFKVLMDFAHNAAGLAAVREFMQKQPVTGRKIVVCGASQDRQLAQIRHMMEAIAGAYDCYILRKPNPKHDELHADVPALCQRLLRDFGVAEHLIQIVPEPLLAAESALQMAGPGDFVVLHMSAADFDDVWSLVKQAIP